MDTKRFLLIFLNCLMLFFFFLFQSSNFAFDNKQIKKVNDVDKTFDNFYHDLLLKVPDWIYIRRDLKFIKWLGQIDKSSGKSFHSLLLEQFTNKSVIGIAIICRVYKCEIYGVECNDLFDSINYQGSLNIKLNQNINKNVSKKTKYDRSGVKVEEQQANSTIHKEDKSIPNYTQKNYLNQKIDHEGFYKKLTEYVPNWKDINKDPEFIEWVEEYEYGTYKTRKEIIIEAFNNFDPYTVAKYFTLFEQYKKSHMNQSQKKLEEKRRYLLDKYNDLLNRWNTIGEAEIAKEIENIKIELKSLEKNKF